MDHPRRFSALVADGELLVDVFGGFEFVDEGDGVVFGGDAAVSLLVGDERGGAEAEFAGALAGLNKSGGREVGPQKVGLVEDVRSR